MKITIGLAVLSSVLMCSAVTITYRDGRTLVCDILAKDDTNLIVRAAKGVQTNSWRQLAPASIKAVHPALFARLTQQALERKKQQDDEMKAKGMILVGGKWMDQKAYEEKALARVRLAVVTAESAGKYERFESKTSSSLSKLYRRQNQGVLKIKLEGLDHAQTHKLRIQYACHVSYEDGTQDKSKGKEQTETINKQPNAEFEYRSEPYYEYKQVANNNVVIVTDNNKRGKKTVKQETEIKNWQIKLWLDEKLVYERTPGGTEEYHLLAKW